jgi:hypothetical protein
LCPGSSTTTGAPATGPAELAALGAALDAAELGPLLAPVEPAALGVALDPALDVAVGGPADPPEHAASARQPVNANTVIPA